MGIDAHIVIRNVPRSIVTDEWLKEKSWRLCESIGAETFFISDGLPAAEYERANAEWYAKFNAHRLYPAFKEAQERDRWPKPDDAWRRIREEIVADIGEYDVKKLRLAIEPVGLWYREEGDPEPGTHYSDDGPVEIVARPDECLLRLNLWGRYYGPGYERGDILKYCAIAEWLEQNIQGCEVWYGGDSSGIRIRKFDAAYREKLRKHLYTTKGRDYFNYGIGRAECRPKACGLCPGGKYRGSQFGSGSNYAAFHCAGCGKSVETRDNGQSWQERKED